MEVSHHVSSYFLLCVKPLLTSLLFVYLSLDIDSSILDALDVQELEYLIKLNIQKGKAFSSLGQGKDGFNAYQSALDVSIILCCTPITNLHSFFLIHRDKFHPTDTSLRPMRVQQRV